MERKISIITILFAGITDILTLKPWISCSNFSDILHHSGTNLALQIESYVHAEKGTSLFLTRLFINKLSIGLANFYRFYFQFFDIRFGTNWFSPIGYFGILSGFYYLFTNKKKRVIHWIILAVLLILPFIEIVIEPHISILLKSGYLWIPYEVFSFYGIYQFIMHGSLKKRIVIVFLIILFSLWWLNFLPYDMQRYCTK